MSMQKQKKLSKIERWQLKDEDFLAKLGLEVEDLRIRLNFLKKLKSSSDFRKLFPDFYHLVTNSVKETLSIGIMRLSDRRKNVLSLLKVLEAVRRESEENAKELEEVEEILVSSLERIKEYRNNYLAHKNAQKFFEFKNKLLDEVLPEVEELEDALNVLKEVVWRVSKAFGLPMSCGVLSDIEIEMNILFESLGCRIDAK